MRLIDADALLRQILSEYADGLDVYELGEAIDNAPTIGAVKVIRCHACKHAEGHWKCSLTGLLNSAYDFCSRGERK